MSEIGLSKPATARALLDQGIGENRVLSFFDEVEPSTPYNGGYWTLKQINKWAKSNAMRAA